jgi:hypothetical protein
VHAREHEVYLQACIFFAFFSVVAVIYNLIFSLALIGLILYTTVFYVLVTRIVEGVTVRARSKIRSGVAGDAVVVVSDLAATAVMLSLPVPDPGPMAVPASTFYWMHLINPGGTASLVCSIPVFVYARFESLLHVLCSRPREENPSSYSATIHKDVTRISL